jgi:hypothetical protein
MEMNDEKTDKPVLPDEVKAFLSNNGKKGGATNKKKGSQYFKYVVSHRKKK